MRQAELQSLFLQNFGRLFPQFRFRGLRRFPSHTHAPFAFALSVSFGKAEVELDLLCATLVDGHPQDVRRMMELVQRAEATPAESDAVPVLVAPFFSDDARALCREKGLGYFDLAGNAGLDAARVYVDVEGKANRHVRKRELGTPFLGKSERIVRRLLIEPGRRWNMRELAVAAEVSLGLASMVTSSLAEMGVIGKQRSGTSLYDPRALLDAWAEHYDLRRSPFRVYRAWRNVAALEADLARRRDALADSYALTLWSGAYRLLTSSEPAPHLALYWRDSTERLVAELGLNEDAGNTYVFVFRPFDDSLFWGRRETEGHLFVVHPLQLYLDLGSGDEEEVVLAQRVRDRLLSTPY